MNDTATHPVLLRKRQDESAVLLARMAVNLELLSGVLAGYPERNPQVWRSPEWAKDLKDLMLACEQLRRYSQELGELVQQLDADTKPGA